MTHAHDDSFGEFAQELRALAETLLERIEPALRRAAADDRQWDSCSWCPVCAAAALVRGEHHEVVAAIADHGTAIVTVLREALAGVPVEPLLPDDLPDPDAGAVNESGTAADEFDPGLGRTAADGWIAEGVGAQDADPGAANPAADEGRHRAGATRSGRADAQQDGPARAAAGGTEGSRAGGAGETSAAAAEPGDARSGRRSKRAGRGRDSAERTGYVPIPVRFEK